MGCKPICHFSLFQELSDLREAGVKHFRNIQVDEANMLCWQGLIVPVSAEWVQTKPSNTFDVSSSPSYFFCCSQDSAPYEKGAFRIELTFPAEYPFKPPKITFKTKIYHPNIDEKGQVCLPIISPENWKPATKTDQGKGHPALEVIRVN